MQYHVDYKGNKKPHNFYLPDESPINAYEEYLNDKSKNLFVARTDKRRVLLTLPIVALISSQVDADNRLRPFDWLGRRSRCLPRKTSLFLLCQGSASATDQLE
jgi:hypothetical protein